MLLDFYAVKKTLAQAETVGMQTLPGAEKVQLKYERDNK